MVPELIKVPPMLLLMVPELVMVPPMLSKKPPPLLLMIPPELLLMVPPVPMPPLLLIVPELVIVPPILTTRKTPDGIVKLSVESTTNPVVMHALFGTSQKPFRVVLQVFCSTIKLAA